MLQNYFEGMAPAFCEVMMDPFGGGPQQELFDTRFIYHKTMYNHMDYETAHNVRMFKQASFILVSTLIQPNYRS